VVAVKAEDVPIVLSLPCFATMIGSYRLWTQADFGVLTKAGITIVLAALFVLLVRAVTGSAEELPC
jgi:hypothetical protein